MPAEKADRRPSLQIETRWMSSWQTPSQVHCVVGGQIPSPAAAAIDGILFTLMAPATKMPQWLEPMAATLTQERFNGGEWLFERKFDGIRLLAYKRGNEVQLFSRNQLPQNLPPLAA